MEENYNKDYNEFSNIRRVTSDIIDYLVENNPDLLKLLYYTDSTPLQHSNLTTKQIQEMICKRPDIEDTSLKSILFQTEIDEGLNIAKPQLRIELGDIVPMNAHRGAILINFQIVVPNKQKIIVTEYSEVDDRSVAIFQELTKTLNGAVLGCLCSPLYLDRKGNEGRTTGAYRDTRQNKNYSGYWVTFAALT